MVQWRSHRLALAFVLLWMVINEARAQDTCCYPDQFEAYVGILEGYYVPATDTAGEVEGHDFVSYDFTNQRMMNNLTLDNNGNKTRGIVIVDYKKGEQYSIFNDNCITTTIHEDLPHCIPENANVTGMTYFGAGHNRLEFNNYYFLANGLPVYVTMTKNDCIPISQTVVGELSANGTVEGLILTSFVGISLGIRNPKIFEVPDICYQSA